MNEHLAYVEQKRLERVQAALVANRMEAFVVPTAAAALAQFQQLAPAGVSVACGGSVTLQQCGVTALLEQGGYQYFDRRAPGADPDTVMHQAFGADVYTSSAVAVTEQGEIYLMDGRGNRVAAICYGPKKVVLIVGRNKIVPDLAAARLHNRLVAAPANAHRLSLNTPCATTGICSDCQSPSRICCDEVVLRWQSVPGRIQVILVGEELGF